ncbi:hypothetical protein [Curtobacterium sp. MCLR17_054]|uniref:hypothetical protein n=1 Tax=Curtobacterium sp. MCLR17_054 TaxID=2175632 RepID=UPI000DAA0023|nr:hypothetical protein [Curtobacterium sp. MCLR17_054]WIE70245.1 hypothetical protein DEJ08_018555 [Curtobacterium sp. MCLR17_054]
MKAAPPAPREFAFTGSQLPILATSGAAIAAAALGLIVIGLRRRRNTTTTDTDSDPADTLLEE